VSVLSLSASMPFNKQHGDLQVRKKHWARKKMPQVAYLDEAAKWSKDLTRMRARGPGDTENAMRSIERDYGIDYWMIWRLRYRLSSLKDIGVTAYMTLKLAYQAECERQMRKLKHEITITEALAGPDCNTVRAVKALVGENN